MKKFKQLVREEWAFDRLGAVCLLVVYAGLGMLAIWLVVVLLQSFQLCTPGQVRAQRDCITRIWANNMSQCTQQGPEYTQTCGPDGVWRP